MYVIVVVLVLCTRTIYPYEEDNVNVIMVGDKHTCYQYPIFSDHDSCIKTNAKNPKKLRKCANCKFKGQKG